MNRLLSLESRILLVHNCAVEPARSHHCGPSQEEQEPWKPALPRQLEIPGLGEGSKIDDRFIRLSTLITEELASI